MQETRCEQCRSYAKLEVPFCYDKSGYQDGVIVHGFCGKDASRSFGFYPVYIPDGGVCKSFCRRSGIKKEAVQDENQIALEGVI